MEIPVKSGTGAEFIVRTSATTLGPNRYKLTSTSALKDAEYLIYVLGSTDAIKGAYGEGYDFTVEQQPAWILEPGEYCFRYPASTQAVGAKGGKLFNFGINPAE